MLAPTWHHLLAAKAFIDRSVGTENESVVEHSNEELQKLRLENALLKTEITHLKEIMQREMQILSHLSPKDQKTVEATHLLRKRHKLELQKLLQLQLQAVPAKIIFRSPASWNSSVWIDVGQATNEVLGLKTIVKNSPVVVGTSVVGVIDYVGKKQSRVRLITDSGLTPSVRAMRTNPHSPLIAEKIHAVIKLAARTKCPLASPEEQEGFVAQLEKAAQNISAENESTYLAKGEIHGASKPLWRAQRHLLKGSGFNYDFADGEGPARDLRTGKPLDGSGSEGPGTPLLKVGDILVTTGMDGVFPPDLLVAEITKVHLLKEGDYYYELDALPTAGNLDDLSLVFVLPPIGYDEEDQPSSYEW